jgi:uncharacterized glyoxalase superfamily protein PhnB/ketosteroid isomerase-like protein
MSDLQAIADRVEIEALRGEFTDAVMMRDYDRLASLFTRDGVVRIPHVNAEAVSREEIRAGVERLQGLWDYFVQTTHPGAIQLEGDTALGRAYISELGRMRDGRSQLNYAVYHDRYQRTPDGWEFTERVYEVRYLDTTPLAGSTPDAAGAPADPKIPSFGRRDPKQELFVAKSIPSRYRYSVIPHVMIDGAAAAIEFYAKAFDAVELFRIARPDGRIVHAEITIGDSLVMVGDADAPFKDPRALGGLSVGLHFYVDNVDARLAQAVDAGAVLVQPGQDMFYGDRMGMVTDPFGHLWVLLTHQEDLHPEEIKRRGEAQLASSA